jgi:hypothetical protein
LIFDLDRKRGLIQGITSISELTEIKVSDLMKFGHTPPGETTVFAASQKVEVVSFGGHHARGGFVSKLETQVIELEANAKLTGPVAWRIVKENEPSVSNLTANDKSDKGTLVMFGFLLLMLAAVAFIAPWAALAVVGTVSLIGLAVYFGELYSKSVKRNIAAMGSLYVFAPSERTWGGESVLST